MNKLRMIVSNTFKELKYTKGTSLIVVLSLAVSFTFVLLFNQKILSIFHDQALSRFHTTKEQVLIRNNMGNEAGNTLKEALRINLEAESKASVYTEVNHILVKSAQNNQQATLKVVEFSGALDDYYQIYLQSKKPLNEMSGESVIVAKAIAEQLDLHVGDEVMIEGQTYPIFDIFESYEYRHAILSKADVVALNSSGAYNQILVNEASIPPNIDTSADVELIPLSEEEWESISGLNLFALFNVAFSLLFIAFSLTNCLLVFEGRLKQLSKQLAIKRFFGMRWGDQLISLLVQNLFFFFVAYHVGLLFTVVFKDFMPDYFAYALSFGNYLFTAILLCLFMILYSLILNWRLNREQLVLKLKE